MKGEHVYAKCPRVAFIGVWSCYEWKWNNGMSLVCTLQFAIHV